MREREEEEVGIFDVQSRKKGGEERRRGALKWSGVECARDSGQ